MAYGRSRKRRKYAKRKSYGRRRSTKRSSGRRSYKRSKRTVSFRKWSKRSDTVRIVLKNWGIVSFPPAAYSSQQFTPILTGFENYNTYTAQYSQYRCKRIKFTYYPKDLNGSSPWYTGTGPSANGPIFVIKVPDPNGYVTAGVTGSGKVLTADTFGWAYAMATPTAKGPLYYGHDNKVFKFDYRPRVLRVYTEALGNVFNTNADESVPMPWMNTADAGVEMFGLSYISDNYNTIATSYLEVVEGEFEFKTKRF